jgi:hypothetical protein
LRDITIRDSPGWTCHLCLCDNVWVQGVQLTNYVFAGNSDGFDVDGCRDVFFHNCRIETGDDAIVLKSFPATRGCERVIVSNCIMRTLCAGLKIGTESWHDVRDIHFHDSIVYQSSRGFQITNLDGACIDGVHVSNLSIDTNTGNLFNRPIHIDVGRRRRSFLPGVTEDTQPPAGVVRNVHLTDIHARTDGRVLLTAGDGGRLEDVHVRNLSIEHPWVEDPADTLHCDTLQGSVACPRARAACGSVVAENIDRLSLRGLRVRYPTQPPGEDFVPKYENGTLVRDPRREFEPMPVFERFTGIDLRDADIAL